MVFAKDMKAVALGLAAMALSLGTSEAIAQGKGDKVPVSNEQKQPNLWYKLCNEVPTAEPTKPGEQPKQQKPEDMKKAHVCLTQLDVRDSATAILVGKIVVRQVQGQDKPQLMAMLPLGASLPIGALVKIDEHDPIRLTYTSCDRAGCYAEATIEPVTVDQMKSGKQITYRGLLASGGGLSIPLALDGFAKAIEGQPMPMDQYKEDQRRIADAIKTRLAEQNKKDGAVQNSQNAPGR
jgi:invasion protein IalB